MWGTVCLWLHTKSYWVMKVKYHQSLNVWRCLKASKCVQTYWNTSQRIWTHASMSEHSGKLPEVFENLRIKCEQSPCGRVYFVRWCETMRQAFSATFVVFEEKHSSCSKKSIRRARRRAFVVLEEEQLSRSKKSDWGVRRRTIVVSEEEQLWCSKKRNCGVRRRAIVVCDEEQLWCSKKSNCRGR